MKKNATNRETISKTLNRYRKNKENIAPDDLKGKYRAPFQKLADELQAEAESYLKHILLDGIQIKNDDCGLRAADDINSKIANDKIGASIGDAIFHRYSLEEAEAITKKEREKIIEEIYKPYLKEA